MAKSANLNIRIDPEIKKDAEILFKSFGITVSDAVNLFLHQSLMVGSLPFEVRQPRYNAETEAAMQEACDMIAGIVQTKNFSSLQDFLTDMKENE